MMAAKFTQGDSIKSTRSIAPQGRRAQEPETRSKGDGSPKGGNTMNGMPGYIDAHQPESMGHAKGGKGFGPHREGAIGEKGGSGAKAMGKGKAVGTTVRNYKSVSTDSAGSLKGNESTGEHHVHTGNRTHKMPGQKAPPTTSGNITGRRVGIDMKSHDRKNDVAAGIGRGEHQREGHKGRMESMKGRAQTSWEGRRKSSMY
jgi:hypothetical protein